jgi:hypothetical protein
MTFQIQSKSVSLVQSARRTARMIFVRLAAIAVLMALPLATDALSDTLPKKIVLCRLANVPDQLVGGEILRVAYAKLDHGRVPGCQAKRAPALSSAGDVDGEIQRVAAVAQQYPTLLQLKPAINYIEPAVFTTGLEFAVDGWNSIKEYEVGIMRGIGSSEAGASGMSKVQRATSLEEFVRMLDRGRFDLLVTDLFSEIRRERLDSHVRPLLPPLERIHIYHYLHERHRALVPQVEAVLGEMADSGELGSCAPSWSRMRW